tara:strand:+ start:2070 stop:2837 length:768 start_codon:yes stop_codon:yes gene_type:complete
MLIYFNANNKATLETLKECGVKNVMLSHRYSYANISKFNNNFENIMVVAGTKGDPEKYWDFLKKKKDMYNYATQFDVYYDMENTIKYMKKEREQGIDWTLPVLQGNFLQHLSRIQPKTDDYVCLGEVRGKFETEDQIRKLPANLRFHGLAKGKYIQQRLFHSMDTSAWISAAMSKKTEIWNNNTTFSMFFGEKGRGMIPILRHSCEKYKDNMEKLNITVDKLIDLDYYSLLKVPFALLFIPLCKSLGIYEENFNN